MAYTRVNWVDLPATTTPVDAANLNVMDAGIAAAYVQGTGGLLNADIGAGAAIAKSKLASLDILNADVDAAAAIAISKLADPGAGNVITSVGSGAIAAKPPGFEIGYDQITSPATVSSTSESSGTTVISASAHTFDGSPVIATFYAPGVATAASLGAIVVVSLFESTTQIGRLGIVQTSAAGAFETPLVGMIRFTPTAGSHSYTVTAFEGSGGGTITAGAGGTTAYAPAFLRFTKV